jgi:hypothetical protein
MADALWLNVLYALMSFVISLSFFVPRLTFSYSAMLISIEAVITFRPSSVRQHFTF